MEVFYGLREREAFFPHSQLVKCHKHLKDNLPTYSLRIEDTAALVHLAYRFMSDRNRRQWLYLYGVKHFEDVDGQRFCTDLEEERLGPWIHDFETMVAAEFPDKDRIVGLAREILYSLFEFRDQQWDRMFPDDEDKEDATASALEEDWVVV